jgi:4-nitrophenyl phosphatase
LPATALVDTVVIGDDPALEMRMARTAGATGVAVTTGLNDQAAFARARAAEQPDIVLSGLRPLLGVWG